MGGLFTFIDGTVRALPRSRRQQRIGALVSYRTCTHVRHDYDNPHSAYYNG
jgi:hypothetical protein